MQAFPGFNISDLEAQLTTAVAAGELLSLLNDLMVPATSVELVDALPFASAPGPGGATASGEALSCSCKCLLDALLVCPAGL